MRASEFVKEADMSRRGFLGALGAGAAMAAAPSISQAGEFMGIGDFGGSRFVKEGDKLEKRIAPIFQKLLAASGKDAEKLKYIKVGITSTPQGAEAYDDGRIMFDVSIFYDLSDDCIAYTLGHEMGHVLYGHHGYKGVSPQQAHKNEMMADVYGAKLAYKCGYNPKEAFADMDAAEKKARSSATHPDYKSRVSNVKQQTGIPVASIQDLQHNKQAIRNFMLA